MLAFLSAELAPKPGRLESVLRITVLTVLVVILSETLQIPEPAYSAYVVFFISKEESASTILLSVIATLAITISVFLAIAIYTISAGEPGLRLPLMAIIIFASMYISRISMLGVAAFGIGFLCTLSLTFIDIAPTADILTRSVLWLWVIIMLPIGMVIIGNILSGRDPIDLFNQVLRTRIELAGKLLLNSPVKNLTPLKHIVASALKSMGSLLSNLKMARIFHKNSLQANERNQVLVAYTTRLLTLLAEWKQLNISDPLLLATASECGAMLLSVAQTIKEKKTELLSSQRVLLAPYEGGGVTERKAFLLLKKIIENTEALLALLVSQSQPKSLSHLKVQPQQIQKQLLAADAFSNPDYFRYALKTTLAIFIAYITYNILDWPGIRTCMVTCFVVSLGSVGETMHKMALRMVGAIIGGGLGLATIIFIIPYLTSITELCLLIAVVAFFAGWVAMSSERLSYAGLQIAFAFFLCILVGYEPTIDMTLARDRVIGILLGNLIIFIVFTTVWPTSELAKARLFLATALNNLTRMFSATLLESSEEQSHLDTLFFAFGGALSQARRLVFLEPENILGGTIIVDERLIDAVQALYSVTMILGDWLKISGSVINEELITYLHSVSTWLSQLAAHLTSDTRVLLPLPNGASVVDRLEETMRQSSVHTQVLAFADWYRTLNERVQELDRLIKRSTIQDSNL